MFNNDNFLHSFYKNKDYKVIISLCVSPESDSPFYSLATIDESNNELLSMDFDNLGAACNYANDKYEGLWDFEDLSVASGGGCSTCTAH